MTGVDMEMPLMNTEGYSRFFSINLTHMYNFSNHVMVAGPAYIITIYVTGACRCPVVVLHAYDMSTAQLQYYSFSPLLY